MEAHIVSPEMMGLQYRAFSTAPLYARTLGMAPRHKIKRALHQRIKQRIKEQLRQTLVDYQRAELFQGRITYTGPIHEHRRMLAWQKTLSNEMQAYVNTFDQDMLFTSKMTLNVPENDSTLEMLKDKVLQDIEWKEANPFTVPPTNQQLPPDYDTAWRNEIKRTLQLKKEQRMLNKRVARFTGPKSNIREENLTHEEEEDCIEINIGPEDSIE